MISDSVLSFERHLEYERKFSPNTIQNYLIDLQQFEDFYIQLQDHETEQKFDIQRADYYSIRAWIVSLLEDKSLNGKVRKRRTVNRKIATLKSFFHFLRREGVIVVSPMQRIRTLQTEKNLPIYVKEDDMKRLLEQLEEGVLNETEKLQDYLIIELLYGTGIRCSELINLKKNDIDFENSAIKVTGKRNKQRIIPIHKILLDFLKKFTQINSSIYLVSNKNGEQASRTLVYRTVKKLLGRVTTLERRSPHIIRHSFATHLLNNGADLKAIQELLGHSSLAATQVYTHLSIEQLKGIFEKAHPKAD